MERGLLHQMRAVFAPGDVPISLALSGPLQMYTYLVMWRLVQTNKINVARTTSALAKLIFRAYPHRLVKNLYKGIYFLDPPSGLPHGQMWSKREG